MLDYIIQALNAVYQGKLVNCSAEEYPEIRTALQDQAGKWIEGGDGMRAMIALQEVKRLDAKFGD
jgi:hypothetical protein